MAILAVTSGLVVDETIAYDAILPSFIMTALPVVEPMSQPPTMISFPLVILLSILFYRYIQFCAKVLFMFEPGSLEEIGKLVLDLIHRRVSLVEQVEADVQERHANLAALLSHHADAGVPVFVSHVARPSARSAILYSLRCARCRRGSYRQRRAPV